MLEFCKGRRPRILLGVTGSVAAVKGPELVLCMVRTLGADVKVLMTKGGEHFWNKSKDYNPSIWNEFQIELKKSQSQINHNTTTIQLHFATEEWSDWNKLGDSVLHIEIRDWADIAVLAPLSAHTLAKLATGLCDDTLSCCLRAWDFGHGSRPGKPILLAPAMNTAMYIHPLTQTHIQTIQSFWNNHNHHHHQQQNFIRVIEPIKKELACGEIGSGALATIDSIINQIQRIFILLSSTSSTII